MGASVEERIEELEHENQLIREEIAKLMQKLPEIPRSAIISPDFTTRAFAIWGHVFVVQLVLGVFGFFIFMILGAILGLD